MKRPFVQLSILILALSFLGLLAIYNASVVEGFNDFGDKYHFVKQQAVWLLTGLFLFILISRLPISFIKKIIPFGLFFSLILMVVVIVPGIGLKLQGARRWLNFGFFGIQPSELFKVMLVVYLAYWLEKRRSLSSFLGILAISLGLIMLQPDLGTAIVLGGSSFLVYYLSGAPVKQLFAIAIITLTLGCLLIVSSPYRLKRVQTFLDPTTDTLGSSYHINQILLSLGSGGWLGVGLGRSLQKHAYLPEATTDSIFAVICEEMGFLGGIILFALLTLLVLLGIRIALKSKSNFAKLCAGGISGLIAIQTFLNLSAMVALVPLTGIPLPLISYGGSSLIATLIGFGILASAAKEK